jgi:aspartyl-tRNA(Asn)/glutamyl-tRNA(Gln) amidotransferase subunit C
MALKKQDVGAQEIALAARIASNARIFMDEEETIDLAGFINEFMGYADELAGVAVSAGGEPSLGSPRARAREDAVRRSDVRDAVLDAAPTRSGSFFVVPRILDPQGEEGSL